MIDTTWIHEKALLYRLECPMRWREQNTVTEPPVLTCGESTARWLIAEQLRGRAPTAKETRDVFDSEWEKTDYFRSRSDIPPKEYARRVLEGVRACRRLRDVVFRCEVLYPLSPYTLPVGDVRITGEYAVLRSSRKKKHAFALYLRHGGVRISPLVPDVVSFARRLDLGNRWTDPVNSHWGIQSIGVLHYWVNRDLAAEHLADLGFALDVLSGAVATVTGHPFPVPGEHCLSCPTRACRPDNLALPPNC